MGSSSLRQEVSKEEMSSWELHPRDYDSMVEGLGRTPNRLECLCYAILWSENYTQKSTKSLLNSLFGGERLARQRSGSIQLDKRRSLALAIADGTGEEQRLTGYASANALCRVLTDLLECGARPLHISGAYRFGEPEQANTAKLLRQCSDGLSQQLSLLGIPYGKSELYFSREYKKKPLVQVFGVGLKEHQEKCEIQELAHRSPVLYVGAETGRDGIGMDEQPGFSSHARQGRTFPQMSHGYRFDAFLRAVQTAVEEQVLEDFALVGEGGIIASLYELSCSLDVGLRLQLDVIPCSEEALSAEARLLSQTPFRLIAVTSKDKHRSASDLFKRFHLNTTTVGEVTPGDDLELQWYHQEIASIPIKHVKDGFQPKAYSLISSPPMLRDRAKKRQTSRVADSEELLDESSIQSPGELSDTWADFLANPNVGSSKAHLQAFDLAAGATFVDSGSSASVYLLPSRGEEPQLSLACSLSCISHYYKDDPYLAAAHSVARALRDLAAVGAEPRGLCFHLTFGDCEQYQEVARAQESLRALRDICRVMNIPALSENIRTGRGGSQFLPVCTVGAIGVIEGFPQIPPLSFSTSGDSVFVIGQPISEFGCCEYLKYFLRIENALVPDIDYQYEMKLCSVVHDLVRQGLLSSVHDIANGGLGLALTESCLLSNRPLGVTLELDDAQVSPDAVLFSEAPSRFLISCKESVAEEVRELLAKSGIMVLGSGVVGGKKIITKGAVNCTLAVKTALGIWKSSLNHVIGVN